MIRCLVKECKTVMKILLVTDAYPPEIRSASHLMLELAEALRDRGHDVTVITTWPGYNLAEGIDSNAYPVLSDENGIRILRVKTLPHHNVNYIIRGLSQLLQPRQFIRCLKRHKQTQFEAVLVYSPPLPLALVGRWLKRRGARFILNLQDLFPQNAIDLGILTNPFLVKLFKKMEQSAYKAADVITTHSEGNQSMVALSHPKQREKLVTLHNWIDTKISELSPEQSERTKKFIDEWGLKEKFVAVFAGVIGPSQALGFAIEAFESLQKNPDYLFLIVGDGSDKLRLQALVKERNLKNVCFKPFISRQDYAALLPACDVGIVSLSPLNKTPVVPGKILGYMAASLPIVAFLNAESDGHAIIKQAGCGFSCVSTSVNNARALLQKAYEAKAKPREEAGSLASIGALGRAYVCEHFSKERCVNAVEALLEVENKNVKTKQYV